MWLELRRYASGKDIVSTGVQDVTGDASGGVGGDCCVVQLISFPSRQLRASLCFASFALVPSRYRFVALRTSIFSVNSEILEMDLVMGDGMDGV